MQTTIRLPDELGEKARLRAAELGLSLNGVIAVALDAYLFQVALDALRVAPSAGVLPSPLQRLVEPILPTSNEISVDLDVAATTLPPRPTAQKIPQKNRRRR